ncbi:ogr/Delta-like zinc finger family protein [Escherichia coli]
MMRCPFCRHSAHTRTSRYVSDNVAYFHERRSLNNFHRDRVITFEQIAE